MLVQNSNVIINNWITAILEDRADVLASISSTQYLENAVKLFDDPEILKKYRFENVEIILGEISQELHLQIFNDRIPVSLRLRCIHAAFNLFDKWYSNYAGYSHSCDHFWDIYYNYDQLAAQPLIQEAIFDTLHKILNIRNSECQGSALHGFNHLRDDRCKPLIDEFIRECTDHDLLDVAKIAKTYGGL